MNTKSSTSKRVNSRSISSVRAKKRKRLDSLNNITDCSSNESVLSECCDTELSEHEGTVEDIHCGIHTRVTIKKESPSTQSPSQEDESFPSAVPSIIQCSTSSFDIPDDDDVKPDISSGDNKTSPLPPSPPRNINTKISPTKFRSTSKSSCLIDIPSRQGATCPWSSDRSSMKIIEFTKSQELLVPAPANPFEAFRLFLDDDILDLIVRETNLNAVKILQNPNVFRNSRIKFWKDLTRDELVTFLGLLLHTGTIRLSRLNDYWRTHWLFNIPSFAQFMSRNRFALILTCLNFSSESSANNRLAKITSIMNHFNRKMQEIYYPGKQLSLDESMVLWRGRLQFGQYIKNKRHKYGIKLYVLAEPDGTIIKFHIYSGSSHSIAGEGHTQKIVFKLLEENLDSGHSVYMDNYYNSYGLAVKLLERGTYSTGTLSENRKGNPIDLAAVELQRGENKSLFLNGVHIGKWRDNRHVLYLSTEHDDEMIEITQSRGQVVVKPSAIIHYKNYMSGLNLQEQLQSYYPCEKKTLLWHKKIFIHTLQMMLINAYNIYNKFSYRKKMNLYDFRLYVLENMLPNPNIGNRLQNKSNTNELQKHNLTKINNFKFRVKKERGCTRTIKEVVRKECRGCRAKNKRMCTVYECKDCKGSPGYCTECFCEAH